MARARPALLTNVCNACRRAEISVRLARHHQGLRGFLSQALHMAEFKLQREPSIILAFKGVESVRQLHVDRLHAQALQLSVFTSTASG
jgi:hypothetical protein